MPKSPSLSELEKPVPLDIVQKEQFDDCTPCRIMGSAAFTGLGIYTYYSGRKQLHERRQQILRSGSAFGIGARKVGVLGLSSVLVGLGIYRLVN